VVVVVAVPADGLLLQLLLLFELRLPLLDHLLGRTAAEIIRRHKGSVL
jgi:hypothetical protein